MAIIYSYPKKNNPQGSDLFVITDPSATGANKNRTKSVDLEAISNFVITSKSAITGSGTPPRIPVFTGPTTIGDSTILDTPGETIFEQAALFVDGFQSDNGGAIDGALDMISGGPINMIDPVGPPTGHDAGIKFNGTNFIIERNGLGQLILENNGDVSINANITAAGASSLFNFGPGGAFRLTRGVNTEFELKGNPGGFYNYSFRFDDTLTVNRPNIAGTASLDVGTPADPIPAAFFRNGVVISNSPGGVQVDNTSMVIGAGNNDIVTGSDNCLSVGNGNQIITNSDNSLAVGQGNTIRNNANNCFAIGQSNTIDGTGVVGTSVKSQVLGFSNLLENSFSSFIAGGQNEVSTEQNAFALGFSHILKGQDSMFAFGENNSGPSGATDINSYMIGGNLQGTSNNMVLGFRNDIGDYPATDYANGLGNTKFVVSVGSVSKSNAIVITEGGVNRGAVPTPQVPRIILPQQETLEFTSDADATAGGIPTGGLYRNGNELRINFNNTEAPGNEGLTILTPHFQTATPGGSDTYTQLNNIVDFDWVAGGAPGIYEYILPSATAIPYRKIRFVNNDTITASTKIHITAPIGETIDGVAFYEISKAYNGCAVWSDGIQWIVIQAKA